MTRACASCSACCVAIGIEELGKPAGVPCPHLEASGRGCAIYDGRPEECADFACGWLSGHFREEDRPDLLGVFLSGATDELVALAGPAAVMAHEARPGAIEEPAVQRLIARLAGERVVLVSRGGHEVAAYGPPSEMEQLLRRHAS